MTRMLLTPLQYFRRFYWHAYRKYYAGNVNDPYWRVACLRRASTQLADSPETLLGLAEALEDIGEFAEAQDLFSRGVTANDANARAVSGAIRTAVKRGRMADALALSLPAENLDPMTLLWLGRAYQRSGNITQAMACYARIPAPEKVWAESRAELAACMRQMGDFAAAKKLVLELQAATPDCAWSQFARANICAIEGDLSAAEAEVDNCLRQHPEIAAAWALKGQIAFERGQMDDARGMLCEALRREPGQAESLQLLAQIALEAKNWEDYFAWQQKYIEVRPQNLEARLHLADMLVRRWRLPEATGVYAGLLNDFPESPEVARQAINFHITGRTFQRANALADKLLESDPAPKYIHLKTKALAAEGRFEAALELLVPLEDAVSLTFAAQCMDSLGRYEEAIHCFEQALALAPDNDDAYKGLGNLEQKRGNIDRAREYLERAYAIAPDKPEHATNLGFLYWKQNLLESAERMFREALILAPDFLAAHLNLCIVLLTQGKFVDGWKEYEWRFRHQQHCDYPLAPSPHNPRIRLPSELLPFDFRGKRVLIAREQGLGDELFFLRFAPRLRERGAWVAYQADPRVSSLVERTGLIDQFVGLNEVVDNIHMVILVGELPLVTGMTQFSDIPPPLPISPLPEWRAQAEALIGNFSRPGKPLIGLTWRAGPENDDNLMRKAVPLDAFADAIRRVDADFVVLQRKPMPGEIECLETILGRRVLDCSAFNDDLEQMLGLVSLLDDYVTVSNTNLHLRVGLGLPTKVLITCPPEYRWMSAGTTSPWYPNIHTYRQSARGEWSAALENLAADLVGRYGQSTESCVAEQLTRLDYQKASGFPAALELPSGIDERTPAFSRETPSVDYTRMIGLYRKMHAEGERFLGIPAANTFPGQSLVPQAERIKRLIMITGTESILDYGSGKGRQYELRDFKSTDGKHWSGIQSYWGVGHIRCYDPCYVPLSDLPNGDYDGVISTDVLEHCPEMDIPWIVAEIFSFARKFVFVSVASYPARKRLPNGENAHCTIKSAAWWRELFTAEAQKHAGIDWELWVESHNAQGDARIEEQCYGTLSADAMPVST